MRPKAPTTSESSGARELFGRYFFSGSPEKCSNGLSTYFGHDLKEPGVKVVIKCANLHAIKSATLLRLQHEVAILRSIVWRHGPAILAWGQEDGLVFLVTPHVPGHSLAERLAAQEGGPLTVDEVLRLGQDVAQQLAEVHAQGILHRDIKPSNIIISGQGHELQASLVDFGLARSGEVSREISQEAAFTARYAAPEQAGLIDHGIDERADLYGLGIVLYEALVGEVPFAASELNAVLMQHLSQPVPSLSGLSSKVPTILDQLVQRLLAKDPRDRYQSSVSLVHDLNALAHCLSGQQEAALVLGAWDLRERLVEPRFVGRQDELRELTALALAAKHGDGGLALLEASSGGGKSRLLAEVAHRAQSQASLVLQGQGVSQAASHPYDVLSGIVRGAIKAARANPLFRRQLRDRLPEHALTLVALIPELAEVFDLSSSCGQHENLEASGESRMSAALMAFLSALGSGEKAALILIDDCQWADRLTLRAIGEWYTGQEHRFVSIILAFRGEEVASQHPLRTMDASFCVSLPALSDYELATLLNSMAGRLPESVVRTVADLSQHNPFMATEVLRGMAETGALVPSEQGWTLVDAPFRHMQSSSRAAAILIRRMEVLPRAALDFLSVGALLGKTFNMALAMELARIPPDKAMAAMSLARRRQIVWEGVATESYSFVHDKLREVLRERLSQEAQQALHLQAASFLAKEAQHHGFDAGLDFQIAYHFDAAAHSARAFPYAVRAAAEARRQFALTIAEQQYRIAERGLASKGLHDMIAVHRNLGQVLILQGSYKEAREHLGRAKQLTSDRSELADIEASLAEIAWKCGDMRQALEAATRGLRLLGYYVPEKTSAFAFLVAKEFLVQTLHSLWPAWVRMRARRCKLDETAALGLQLFSRIGYAYWALNGALASTWAHLRSLNLTERYPESPQLARVYSEHAPAMMTLPWYKRGYHYATRSLAIRKRLGDVWGQGHSLNFRSCLLYAGSRFEEAIADADEAKRLLTHTGDRWEINFAVTNSAHPHYRLGNMQKAVTLIRQYCQEALALGDHASVGVCLGVWSLASRGADVPSELIQQELGRKLDNPMTRAGLLLAEGTRLLLQAKDYSGAVSALREAQMIVQKANLRQEYVAPIHPWLASALRLQAEQLDPRDPQHKNLLGQAYRAYRQALRVARFYRNNLPHTLREGALLAAWRGQPRRARTLVNKSLLLAKQQNARFELALSLEARGQLGRMYNWADAAVDSCEAERLLNAFAYKASTHALAPTDWRQELSIVARFDSVLEAGRGIISALTEPAIYEALLAAARNLFFSDRCLVVARDGANKARVVAGDAALEFSHSLTLATLTEGRAIVFDEGTAAELRAGESLSIADVRSALCVPVRNADRVVACLYISNPYVGRLFQDDELKIGQYLAVLTSAALENAEGFARLQSLNQSLAAETIERKRVAEELQSAKELAEAASRVKSQFLANMSHEMRTPLSAMLGYTHFLKDPEASADELSRFIATIERNGQHLMQLIDNILELTKVDAAYLKLERIAVNMADLVNDLEATLCPQAKCKGIAYRITCQPDLPTRIMTDPLRVRQILLNIIGNAIKFTETGEVAVTVSSLPASVGRPALIKFLVADSGIGIASDVQSQLFRPFTQADTSTTRIFGGTGLGLVLAQRFARDLGGDVELTESSLGLGSSFTVTVAAALCEGV